MMLGVFQRSLSVEVKAKLDFLLKTQRWPQEKLLQYQWKKLKDLLSYSYDNVPYYRTIYNVLGIVPDDINNFQDFRKIPALNKKDIQNHFHDLISKDAKVASLVHNSTGGSTGMPLNFYQDSNYISWADAARLRAWRYVPGYNEDTLEAVLWGAIHDIGKNISFLKLLKNVLRERELTLNTFDLDRMKIERYLKWFNLLRPSLLRGYASSLYMIALFVEENKIEIHSPGAIVSSTEVLHDRMRRKIEEIFRCKIFDSYGCREVSQIATECSEHNGLHIVSENQYVELEGQEIVVTNLNNYAMPFIRYKVGDLASDITYEPCVCGCASPRLLALSGRDNDNIVLPNGKIINGEFFEFLFFGIPQVLQYQVIFYRKEMLMKIKLHVSSERVGLEEILRNVMNEKFDFNNIEFIYSDKFDKTPTGKLRFVYMV